MLWGDTVSSLNHVCVWSEDAKAWIPITAQAAARIYPFTVSGSEKKFICDLCGHYATFTGPGKYTRHFRHFSPEDELNCPEYRYGFSYIPTYSFKEDHQLPIRLVITSPLAHLEIGMLFIPGDILNAQPEKTVTIITSQRQTFEYSFERLNPQTTTYLNVGTEPSKQYRIIAPSALYSIWPKQFEGIPSTGCVFDGDSGRKLPLDSDVTVDTRYYLLTNKWLWNGYQDIELKKLCDLGNRNVYEVKALKCSIEAARFFLDYGYRLTENPLSIVPLWPMHREDSLIIRHNSKQVVLSVSGRRISECRLQPREDINVIQTSDISRAVVLNCNRRDQYFSIGRSSVIQYLYLWRHSFKNPNATPSAEVLDQNDQVIEPGAHDSLPKDGTLYVTPLFDGKVVYKREGIIVDQKQLPSKTRSVVDGITFGTEVFIYQGLDVIWSAVFQRKSWNTGGDDESLYSKLRGFHGDPVPVYHEFGALAGRLRGYPKVRAWIYSTVRKGSADRKAIQYLKHYVVNNSVRKE